MNIIRQAHKNTGKRGLRQLLVFGLAACQSFEDGSLQGSRIVLFSWSNGTQGHVPLKHDQISDSLQDSIPFTPHDLAKIGMDKWGGPGKLKDRPESSVKIIGG